MHTVHANKTLIHLRGKKSCFKKKVTILKETADINPAQLGILALFLEIKSRQNKKIKTLHGDANLHPQHLEGSVKRVETPKSPQLPGKSETSLGDYETPTQTNEAGIGVESTILPQI